MTQSMGWGAFALVLTGIGIIIFGVFIVARS